MSELEELTPEEKTRPYAKYYYQQPAPPAPDPGYHEVEIGYCVMPDGSGYVAC